MGVVDRFAEVINIAETTAKKAEGKRSFPPRPPIRESKGKETARGFRGKLSAPGARAHTRTGKSRRYRLGRAVALEIIETCFGTAENDLGIWARVVYDYPESADDILEKARAIAAEWRQGEIRYPVQRFQKWLGRRYPKKP